MRWTHRAYRRTFETMIKFGGKDYPVNGLANATWAFTRIDDHAYDLVASGMAW